MSIQDRSRDLCGAIWGWEEAGKSLANALSRYKGTCVSLEDSFRVNNINSESLASRIDSSLQTLHVQIANEMVQSRLALVRMRNKISARCYSLPKKILAQIFMDVVYVPTPDDRFQSMNSELYRIYRQLHTLLAVCKTWRNIGVAHPPLWSIIPIYDGWGRSKELAPRLSMDRSTASLYSRTRIHLAALISAQYGFHIPVVEGKIPKFNTVNVMSKSARAILHFLDDLSKPRGRWPTRQRLSELSIYQVREGRRQSNGSGPKFTAELFNPLSILRVRGVKMLWDQIKFSNQLVELRLQSVIFDSNSKLLEFLQALNSAPELRDLKIISVIAFPESSSDSPAASQLVKCPVPKLQTLLLQDLDYNVLQILQASLVQGSYRTTLCLTEKIIHVHEPRKEPNTVNIKDLFKVLKRISVDKLVISGEWQDKAWLDHTELRGTLQSLPTVKTLIMESWRFRKEDLLALERPRPGKKGSKSQTVRFPILTALYLEEAQIVDAEVLKNVVTSHKLQKMSLSGCVAPPPDNTPDSDPDVDIDIDTDGSDNDDVFKDAPNWDYFESDDEIIKWLRTQVAQFRLDEIPETESRDYMTSEWQLW